MNRDREEELQRLENELLEQDDVLDEETPEEDNEEFEEEDTRIGDAPAVYQNFANNYGKDLRNFASGYKAYNTDDLDVDLEEFSQEVQEEKTAAPMWLPILLTLLIGAVVGAIVWFYLSLGGMP